MSKSEIPQGSKEIRCIVCPTGCLVHVENVNGELIIEGHSCKRGEEYAKEEFTAPKRILTTTMRVENGFLPLIPVRSHRAIPKERLKDTLKEIAQPEQEPRMQGFQMMTILKPVKKKSEEKEEKKNAKTKNS